MKSIKYQVDDYGRVTSVESGEGAIDRDDAVAISLIQIGHAIADIRDRINEFTDAKIQH